MSKRCPQGHHAKTLTYRASCGTRMVRHRCGICDWMEFERSESRAGVREGHGQKPNRAQRAWMGG